MNDPKLSSAGLGALAVLVAHLRDDWQPAGIRTALDRAAARPVTGYELAHAALNAAANPTVRTPAVIALDGQHWQRPAPAEAQTPGPKVWPRCARCHAEVTEGLYHADHCGPLTAGMPEGPRHAASAGIRQAGIIRRAADLARPHTIPSGAKLSPEHPPPPPTAPPTPHRPAHGESEAT